MHRRFALAAAPSGCPLQWPVGTSSMSVPAPVETGRTRLYKQPASVHFRFHP
ncbi:MAG: hypothetical protein IKO09_00535 [Bacteroidales bacterium]|nr:hypothetical protein [Bacteroidales bacterium]